MDGRWTLHVCKDCGERAHHRDRCPQDRRRVWTEVIEVPVVPCDDSAVERAVREVREGLIAATDIVPAGAEPYVGWSFVLAERLVSKAFHAAKEAS